MADALDRRTYQAAVKRHRNNADYALRDVKAAVNRIDVDQPGVGTSVIRNAAGVLAELGQALAALNTLADMSFLVEENTGG